MASFAERLIAAHQAGLQHRQSQEEQAQRAEDRKLQQQILKHQIDRLKITDALDQRQAAAQQAQAMAGQPGQTVPDTTPDASGESTGGTMVLPHAPVEFAPVPGMDGAQGLPGYSLTPPTLQEVMQKQKMAAYQAQQQKQQEDLFQASLRGTTTAPGSSTTFGVPGMTPTSTVDGPPKPPAFSIEDNLTVDGKGPVKAIKIQNEGTPPKFLDINSGQPITGTIGQYERPREPKDTTASDSAKVERSFNERSKELEKAAQPVSDSIQRLGRLIDTIDTASPIADSLTAPELMVVMAGGAGSGVRITTAEIMNIMGGQSKWEQAKAALAQWSTDPAKANKILEPMRGQIRMLLNTVTSKLTAKQSVIEDARQKLIDTEDPKAHKQILADAKKQLTSIDAGGKAEAPDTLTLPNGTVLTKGSDGKYYGK